MADEGLGGYSGKRSMAFLSGAEKWYRDDKRLAGAEQSLGQ